MNIVYDKKNIMINIKIVVNKSLIYHSLPLINLETIVLTITLNIGLIKDQKKEFR